MTEEYLWACFGTLYPIAIGWLSLERQSEEKPPIRYVLYAILLAPLNALFVVALPGVQQAVVAIYSGAAAPLLFSAGLYQIVQQVAANTPSQPPRTRSKYPREIVDDITSTEESSQEFVRIGRRYFKQDGVLRFLLSPWA